MLYWEDDLGTINQALHGSLLSVPEYDWHPPLSFAFTRIWMSLAHLTGAPGEEFALRTPFCAVAALAAPLAFVLARRLGLATISAAGAGAVTAAAPLLLWIDRDIRAYALLEPIVLASHLMMLRALDRDRARDWTAWAVLAALGMWTHYAAIPIAAVQTLLAQAKRGTRSLRPSLVGLGAFGLWLPVLPIFLHHLTVPLGHHMEAVQLNVRPVALTAPAYALFGLVLGHTTFPWRFPIVVPVGLACTGLAIAAARRAGRDLVAWWPLVFGIALPIVLADATPLRMPRYHGAACAMLAIALAQGAEALFARRKDLALLLASIIIIGIARSDANLFLGREYHFLYPLRPWLEVKAKLGDKPVIWIGEGEALAKHYGIQLVDHGSPPPKLREEIDLVPDPDMDERERWTGRKRELKVVVFSWR
jgi:uncharacterized membrane protein